MNILHTVEFYYPSVGGIQEVVKQLSEHLVKLGHRVTVATTKLPDRKSDIINGVNVVEFKIKGKMAMGIWGEKQKYLNYVLNSNFDVITNFAAQQWATDLLLPHLKEIKAKKVFVPTGFSGLYSPFYRSYYQKMKGWLKKYDLNIFHSYNYRDINFARKNKIKKITVIPNGAAKDEFLKKPCLNIRKGLGVPEDHFLILTVGSHTGRKGHAEAIEIFRKAKFKKATLLVVGDPIKFPEGCFYQCLTKALFSQYILIRNFTREQTAAAFQAADLFLFPSRIECSPLVLFESAAAGLPFLTTEVGNSKEVIKWTGGGALLPTEFDKHGFSRVKIRAATEMLKYYYNHPRQLTLMGKRGRRVWLKNFTWDKIARQYENLYKKIS